MSENSEQGSNGQDVAPISHNRILILMAAVTVLGGILTAVFVSPNFGLGVLIGGALSLLNYWWLKRSIRVVIEGAIAGGTPHFLAGRAFVRYLVFGVILAVIYLSKVVPIIAVLLGLASFAVAIILEAFIRIFSSFSNNKEL